MGKIEKHSPVKLIVGFIFRDKTALKKARAFLENQFGRIDFESKILPFNYTAYYEDEFGRDLKRVFISFQDLILPQELARIKITTNIIEKKLSRKGSRLINIDPGYLTLAKLVLASTKDYIHRIYLNRGIYAEITLFYTGRSFRPREWTYPDYQTPEYIAIFKQIRNIYTHQC